MDSFWTTPTYWVSILIVVSISVGLSSFVQSQVDEKKINQKAVVRDGILGAIFATIVWVMSPETMSSIANSATSLVGGAKEAAQTLGNTQVHKLADMDVQVGPAKF